MNCEGDLEIEGGEKRGGGDAAGEGLGTCRIAADLIGLKRGFALTLLCASVLARVIWKPSAASLRAIKAVVYSNGLL